MNHKLKPCPFCGIENNEDSLIAQIAVKDSEIERLKEINSKIGELNDLMKQRVWDLTMKYVHDLG